MLKTLVQENVRNKIKILLKFSKKEDFFHMASISSTISQQSIEDANLLDSFINDFFIEFDFKGVELDEFIIPATIIIFRDETETEINFFYFSKLQVLKILSDLEMKIDNEFLYFYLGTLFKKKYFNLNKYSYFLNFFKTIKGQVKTLKNRAFLKSRKINFRRKIKKDSYDSL